MANLALKTQKVNVNYKAMYIPKLDKANNNTYVKGRIHIWNTFGVHVAFLNQLKNLSSIFSGGNTCAYIFIHT